MEIFVKGTHIRDKAYKRRNSNSLISGARVEQVDEPLTTFIIELEAYPEAKALSPKELSQLYRALGSFKKVAEVIGSSESFATQNVKSKKRNKKENQ